MSKLISENSYSPWRVCVAPMLDWTDRHCRYFHRLLSKKARLYTEMMHTGALIHGEQSRFMSFDPSEEPLALQLGGSNIADLARCAQLAQKWHYDEVNLNCGCPSDRVQKGLFGACLMRNPKHVAECVKAMRNACDLHITIKHRIGLDKDESYSFVRDFVGEVSAAGTQVFIVHARNAWLNGLSPHENRTVPPLRYDVVLRLKADFPHLTLVVNGGIDNNASVQSMLNAGLDGVMIGRKAYREPWWLTQWDVAFFNQRAYKKNRDEVEVEMVEYMQEQHQKGVPTMSMARHMLGLRNGQAGARHWRQHWSNHHFKHLTPKEILQML